MGLQKPARKQLIANLIITNVIKHTTTILLAKDAIML
jgi:hypothetical protein